jgi:hypothetical protein
MHKNENSNFWRLSINVVFIFGTIMSNDRNRFQDFERITLCSCSQYFVDHMAECKITTMTINETLWSDWVRGWKKCARSCAAVPSSWNRNRFQQPRYKSPGTDVWFISGFWIRIDSIRIRIRIQKFSSIRIRIHNVIESGSGSGSTTVL